MSALGTLVASPCNRRCLHSCSSAVSPPSGQPLRRLTRQLSTPYALSVQLTYIEVVLLCMCGRGTDGGCQSAAPKHQDADLGGAGGPPRPMLGGMQALRRHLGEG